MPTTWVNSTNGVPQVRDFTTTAGLGPPICIDKTTGILYALLTGDAVAPIGGGGYGINARVFGVKGDGVTLDYTALVNALLTLKSIRDNFSVYGIGASIPLICQGNIYLGPNTVNIDYAAHIKGFGSAIGGKGTQFKVDDGHSCFSINYPDASGFVLEDFAIEGSFNSVTSNETLSHGIIMPRSGTIRNIQINNFGGYGIEVNASVPTGNSNGFKIEDVSVSGTRAPIHLIGSDTNGGRISGLIAFVNRQCGILNESALGNPITDFLFEANGRTNGWNGQANRPCTLAHKLGNWFIPIRGREVQCSTNAPPATATSDANWIFWKAGVVEEGVPDWFNGINIRAGGGIIATGLSDRTVFGPGYVENDEPSQIGQSVLVTGIQGSDWQNFFQVNDPGIYNAAHVPGAIIDAAGGKVRVGGALQVLRGLEVLLKNAGFDSFSLDGSAAGIDINAFFRHGNSSVAFNFLDTLGNIYADWIISSGLQATFFDHKQGAGAFNFRTGAVLALVATLDAAGLTLPAGKAIINNGNQVVGARGLAVANATHSAAAPTKVEFDAFVDLFNTLKARLEAATGHGLIA